LAGFIDTEIPAGAAPETGETISQAAFETAVQESAPPPEFPIATDCGAGAGPPTTKEKLSCDCERTRAAG
jgi:hypothetical protein